MWLGYRRIGYRRYQGNVETWGKQGVKGNFNPGFQ